MTDTILVTGGTGLTGANVCEQLIARGDSVRALVRRPTDAQALTAIGVEVVQGDIAVADDVSRASKGCDAAIHCAALLGGASQDLADFEAVNAVGTVNVLDAAKTHGLAARGRIEHGDLHRSHHYSTLRRGANPR